MEGDLYSQVVEPEQHDASFGEDADDVEGVARVVVVHL